MTMRQTVTDMVRAMVPKHRHELSRQEGSLAPHLRGNAALFTALTELITSRIEGRARLPLPSNPQACYAIMAMDKELRLLLARLERVYHSPINDVVAVDGEQPAE